MENNIVLTPVPLEALINSIREMIREELKANLQNKDVDKLITGNEVRSMFHPAISRPTLARYVSKGLLQEHRIGGRIFYKRGAVMEAVSKIKRFSQDN